MKELIQQLAAYNLWANDLVMKTLLGLPEEQVNQETKSSFSSLYKTVQHMLDAESIWWQRMKLSEKIVIPSESNKPPFPELVQMLQQQNKQWKEWVNASQEHMLAHEFIYHNSKKEQFKQPVYQMLVHMFNHGTYHRGQLVTILRQQGMEKIPQTDFIVFSRKK